MGLSGCTLAFFVSGDDSGKIERWCGFPQHLRLNRGGGRLLPLEPGKNDNSYCAQID
jgi:hypothetical protein